jgi:hypothetical protein
MVHPSTPPIPREYPDSTLLVPPYYPPSTPRATPRKSGPRTSVGAHPHVVEVGAADAVAADDVDGAGGVDHARVPKSRSPRRVGRAAPPRHTCDHVGKRTMRQTQNARVSVRPSQAEL